MMKIQIFKITALSILLVCNFQSYAQKFSFGLVGGNVGTHNYGSKTFVDSVKIDWQSQWYKTFNYGIFVGYKISDRFSLKSIINHSRMGASFIARTESKYLGGGVGKGIGSGGYNTSVSLEPEYKIFSFKKIEFTIISGLRYSRLYNYKTNEQINFNGEADGYIELSELSNNFDDALKPSRISLIYGTKVRYGRFFLQFSADKSLGRSNINNIDFFGSKQYFYMKTKSQNLTLGINLLR